MNCCRVGTGSPLQPPTAITDVPDAISSAAADCEPFVAADHCVCVAASRPARSELSTSSSIQPPWAVDVLIAVGIEPWCGVAAVMTEYVAVPANPASTPMATATAIVRGHATSTPTAPTTASAPTSHVKVGLKWLRCNKTAEDAAANAIIAPSASLPSQPALRDHAHTPPMPMSAAIDGASAAV